MKFVVLCLLSFQCFSMAHANQATEVWRLEVERVQCTMSHDKTGGVLKGREMSDTKATSDYKLVLLDEATCSKLQAELPSIYKCQPTITVDLTVLAERAPTFAVGAEVVNSSNVPGDCSD